MILGDAKGFGRQTYDENESWTCLACDGSNTVILKAGIKCNDCGQFEKTPKGPNRLYRNMSQAEIEAAGSSHMHVFNWEGVCECGRNLMQEI